VTDNERVQSISLNIQCQHVVTFDPNALWACEIPSRGLEAKLLVEFAWINVVDVFA
jgi:hypothetical protein